MNEEFRRKYFITCKMNSTIFVINLSYFYRNESEKRGNSLTVPHTFIFKIKFNTFHFQINTFVFCTKKKKFVIREQKLSLFLITIVEIPNQVSPHH